MFSGLVKQNTQTDFKALQTLIFSSLFVRSITFVLVTFLCLQPTAPLFADEQAGVDEVVVATETSDEQEEEVELPDEEAEEVVIEEIVVEAFEEPEDELVVNGNEESQPVVTVDQSDNQPIDILLATTTTQTIEDRQTEEDVGDTETSSSTIQTSATSSNSSSSSSSSESSEVNEDSEDHTSQGGNSSSDINDEDTGDTDAQDSDYENASTTDEYGSAASSTETEVESHVVYNNNQIQFDSADCITVADGSYYCSDSQAEKSEITTDSVFAKPDSDGDMEIFIQKNGSLYKITDNKVDDRAPYYDSKSDSIVWHRMINDRYQIISYDLKKGEETVMTANLTNNMEASRAGEVTVWQRWIHNNWEIMMNNGSTTKQLTSNGIHDIAPKVRDGFVLWQTLASDGTKHVTIYEIRTGALNTIDDVDGGAIENPRLVLLYETTYHNGDSVTRGYDFDTGKVIPLAATPAEIPEDIPQSDDTGETRALIQPKIQTKDVEPNNEPDPDQGSSTTTPEVLATTTHSVTDEPVLDLRATTTQSTSDSVSSTTQHIDDLVIPPLDTSTSTETG